MQQIALCHIVKELLVALPNLCASIDVHHIEHVQICAHVLLLRCKWVNCWIVYIPLSVIINNTSCRFSFKCLFCLISRCLTCYGVKFSIINDLYWPLVVFPFHAVASSRERLASLDSIQRMYHIQTDTPTSGTSSAQS